MFSCYLVMLIAMNCHNSLIFQIDKASFWREYPRKSREFILLAIMKFSTMAAFFTNDRI